MNQNPYDFLRIPISNLRGIGEKYARRLDKFGIRTIRDLLWHFPTRYEDFTNIKKINEIKIGETISVIAIVKKISNRRTWKKRIVLTEAVIEDETGTLPVIWFNQPFLTRNIPVGALVSLSGKVAKGDKNIYLSSPEYEVIEKSPSSVIGYRFKNLRHTGGFVPVYPETRGITSRMLRFLIQPLLAKARRLPDILPPQILKDANIMPLGEAISSIHFPKNLAEAAAAKKRFAFEAVFLVQMLLRKNRAETKNSPAPAIPTDLALIRRFVAALPFTLTDGQRKAAWQILQDMAKPSPMNRLLNGDVGSGKTVVASIAALQAIDAGYQVAILAPTEILARQHFKKFVDAFASFPVKIALNVAKETLYGEEGLSGPIRSAALLERIKNGVPIIVIGTHALLQKNVRFGKLGLVVVDEQHRFGVEQRAKLTKGTKLIPHLLSMSATPIPRTLALGLYGDLDISILNELPKGRQKIITRIIPPALCRRAYKFIRDEIEKGHQAFVICPRIDPETHQKETDIALLEESPDWKIEVKAVKTEFEKLSKTVFPDLKVAMLHGRMRSDEKESVMAQFSRGKTDILVSTSVVEVGVDVPNATVMMIDGAEHFGLSQLHQFRGRVGRGPHQSYCLLFTESNTKSAKSRLMALVESDNGFELAERDLQIRGPGQFFGTQQSGLPDLAMRSLTDLPLVELARREAIALLQKDPKLNTAHLLKARLEEFEKEVHLE